MTIQKDPQFERVEKIFSSPFGTWLILNVSSRIDPFLLRVTGGRYSVAPPGTVMVLLETIGAKSGKVRKVALVGFADGNQVILIASNGGQPKHPAWYHNLKANPQVTASIRGKTNAYTTHEAEGADRDRLWARAVGFYNGYAVYQERTGGRRIPVMILTPEKNN
jgi:deazaflavin-dependent oxidoreductase (nitroreductase family)